MMPMKFWDRFLFFNMNLPPTVAVPVQVIVDLLVLLCHELGGKGGDGCSFSWGPFFSLSVRKWVAATTEKPFYCFARTYHEEIAEVCNCSCYYMKGPPSLNFCNSELGLVFSDNCPFKLLVLTTCYHHACCLVPCRKYQRLTTEEVRIQHEEKLKEILHMMPS